MDTSILEIRDENGKGYDVVKYEDLLLPNFFRTIAAVEKKLSAIKQLEYKEGDVFLCGYPKCGNHWMSNLISYMLYPGPVESKMSINLPLVDLYSIKEIRRQPCPRLFTSHFKMERLPQQHLARNGKIILILRNPKDVAVSYYYHLKHRSVNSQQSWKHFVQCFLEGVIINGSYFDYLNAWAEILKSRHSQNILVIYYEDLVQDCFMQLKKIQGFLGTGKSDSQLQQIVSRCSIDRLRSDVNKGHVRTLLVNEKGESHLYRKGKVGDWKSHFTIDQDTAFDRQIELQLKDCSFQFQYECNDIPSKL